MRWACFCFYALVVDAAIEGLDWIHRLYSSGRIDRRAEAPGAPGNCFTRCSSGQALSRDPGAVGAAGLDCNCFASGIADLDRKRIYFASAFLILLGVLAMRWNVVIGGQLFSKSLRGFTTFKMEIAGHEGWLISVAVLILPFVILGILIQLFLRPGSVRRSKFDSDRAVTRPGSHRSAK